MTAPLAGDCNPAAAAAAPAVDVPAQKLDPDLEAVLRPFLDHSAAVTSIVAIGYRQLCAEIGGRSEGAASIAACNEGVLLRVVADPDAGLAIVARIPIPPAGGGPGGSQIHTLDSLARQARELCNGDSCDHLILLPARMLEGMIVPSADDFGFRAVSILSPRGFGREGDESVWKLQRILFDRGLVGIGSVQLATAEARCFLASDAVRSLHRLGVGSRGYVTMSTLGSNGAFANQLFQYAYLKLYALRHGLTAAIPAWQGRQLFDLHDPPCAGLTLPELRFDAFVDDDRPLWDRDDPPIDIDLWGYFQETPECWRRHRPLLRRMFQLPVEHQQAIDAWHSDATCGGRRTLVAIHVRRGDYRNFKHKNMPWFRLVPEDWYLAWLRRIWPTLCDPLLFVATDEPDAILPVFEEFETIPAAFGTPARALPDHIRDFEILRRADCLAICNSSFSRLAAILAHSAQQCFLPSFQSQGFVPYKPWIDTGFWARFAEAALGSTSRERIASDDEQRVEFVYRRGGKAGPMNFPVVLGAMNIMTATVSKSNVSVRPTLYFDVSDLLLYLWYHATLTGIQRVQCEIIRNLLDVPRPETVRLIALDARGLGVIETSALLDIIEHIRSDTGSRADLGARLSTLSANAVPAFIGQNDIFLTIGAFWSISGAGMLLQHLKNSGVIIGVYIHDIISVTDPEYFNIRDTRVFVKGLGEALTFADFILTTSEYTKASLIRHMAGRKLQPLPVNVVPLAHELSISVTDARISSIVTDITNTEYVLCVGTIEVRKNPIYLFNIWKLMIRAGRANIPTLVFAGRKGWLVNDFMEQLKASKYLDGRVVVLHDVTDVELTLLYRKCLLTMYPSMAEGWGLPVGESLAYGKISIASRAGGIPEVGGELVDYIDPYNASDGLELLLRYLDDPELRHNRERELARHFEPRPWRKVADDFLNSAQALARQVRPFQGIAAIKLPPNRYLPISSDVGAIALDGMDGELSADLICTSGWRRPELWGVWADDPATTLRFRTDAPAGTRIHLLMRLIAPSGDLRRIRISSGSGAEIEVSLAGWSDSLAVLSCEVEPGNLVSARMSIADAGPGGSEGVGAPYLGLKGILYIHLERLEGKALERSADNRSDPHIPTRPLMSLAAREQPDGPERSSPQPRIPLLQAAPMDNRHRAASFGAFLHSADSYWPFGFTTYRDAPILADDADKQIFYDAQGRNIGAVTDQITLIRRSDQYVSMSRFTEGSVFDRSGVSRALGYLQGSPPVAWLSREADGVWVSEESLAAAPGYEKSYLIFYNGNLHNYYHWMAEGILSLDILARAIGPDRNLNIVLPKSMDIAAVFDHRESLRAVGLDGYKIVEAAANLIKVREAIWVENDLVQSMPAPCLKDFQRRVAARYAGSGGPRCRRLFVARKGPTRKIHNIEQVQAFLSNYDFETVYLEGMSIVEQILLFQSAEFVISPHGAGLTNLLFCEPGTKVIEFASSVEIRPFFWLISQKLDLVYGVQFCAAAEGPGFQAALTVDVDKLEALYRMVNAHC